MTTKNLVSKFFAIVLSISLLAGIVTVSPASAISEPLSAPEDESPLTLEKTDTEADIISEDDEGRSLYGKDFLLSDMTRLAVIYPDAVHFPDGEKWIDIDNSLELSDGIYRNKANTVKMELPEELSSETGVRVTYGDDSVGFVFLGAKNPDPEAGMSPETTSEGFIRISPSTAEIENECIPGKAIENERERAILPLKLHSRASYREVLPGTDLVYDLNSTKLKETLVLSSVPAAPVSYVFTLDAGGREIALNEDTSISIYDGGGKEVFCLPAPFLYDSEDEFSHDVTVTLEKAETTYILTITPSHDWLTSPERVYPVYIDPSVHTTQIRQNIKDMTVASWGGTDYNDDFIEAGFHRSRGIERTYIKFASLPSLTSADVIIGSELMLYRGTNGSTDLQINAHRVNGSWESNTITWSNKPGYNSTITDYAAVAASGWYEWSITEIARTWYEAGNTGLLLKAPDSTESSGSHNNRTFYSSDRSTETLRPILTITYINNAGYESCWDYDSYALGRAGEIGVNLFTGNTIIQRTDMGFDGERMPVSIRFTYNVNDKLSYDNSGGVINGGVFSLGSGWRTNYNQRVYLFTPSDGTGTGGYTYYIWEDEDGTRHYFRGSSASGSFTDESGIELTLTNTGSGDSKYVITDKNGNTSHFDTYGRLSRISNNQETKSSITVTYMTGGNTLRIDTITDGAGRVYRFYYNSQGGNLSSIVFTGTGITPIYTVNYNIYSGGTQDCVFYPKGKTSVYYYSNGAITDIRSRDWYDFDSDITLAAFEYNTLSADKPNRLTGLKVYDESGSGTFMRYTYAYGRGYTIASDPAGGNLEYQFNRYGNTVSVQDQQGRALYRKYASDTDESAKKNRLTLASKLQTPVNNLFKNPSFERNEFWNCYAPDNAVGSGTYTTAQSYIGTSSYCLTKSSSAGAMQLSAGSGMSLKGNTSYTFSAYVKTTGGTSSGAVCFGANINGATTSQDYPECPEWTRYEFSFTTPATVTSYDIWIRLYLTGSVYIDCVQLEENVCASRYNLVENGDFTYASGSGALKWLEGSGCTSTEYRTTISSGLTGASNIDNAVYTMTGAITRRRRIYQDIAVNGAAGDTYSVGGWAKGNAAPVKNGSYANGNLFGIVVRFYNTDGTESEFMASFNPDLYENSTWQYTCERVVAPKNYIWIRVLLVYELNVNVICYDAIQLFKDEFGSSYIYDANGNITSVTDSRKQTDSYQYSDNNLTRAALANGGVYNYTYDTHHNVTAATSATGVKSEFGYLSTGANNRVALTDPDDPSAPVIESTAVYNSNSNLLSSVTDSIGNTVSYNYNSENSALTSVTGGGSTTAYTYDSLCRTSGASRTNGNDTASLSYTYDSRDHLTGISYGTADPITYSLTYGIFGNLSEVSAGGSTLIANSYTYNSNTNPYYDLSSAVYGNGGRVDYTYNRQGQLVSRKYDGNSSHVISYQYDNEGKTGKVSDLRNGITTRYIYDISGRLVSSGDSGSRSYKNVYTYDTSDNVSKVTDTIEGTAYISQYTYDQDNRNTFSWGGNSSISASYDAYGRKSAETIKRSGVTVNSIAAGYYSPSAGKTSILPASYTNTLPGESIGYTYTYDSYGNIASITDSAGHVRSYEYDSLGQLVRENDEERNASIVYIYDDRGNITSKTAYPYSSGTLSGTGSATVYTYRSTGWKDVLTGMGSRVYTSDAIGNRTGDGTWSYSWEHGRQLASMSKLDETGGVSYTYDAGGLRLSKEVTDGGVTTVYKYYYRGGKLIDYQWSGTDIYIWYDGNGAPYGFSCNYTDYYYIKNAQGDITGIADAAGNPVVAYSYDAWGRLLGTTGTLASTIGAYNPLRYRGYVYDPETELYYLQSRYYDPSVGRFISADAYLSTSQGFTGNNMFAYCGSNPVNRIDKEGMDWEDVFAIGLSIILIGVAIILAIPSGGSSLAAAGAAISASSAAIVGEAAIGAGAVVAGSAIMIPAAEQAAQHLQNRSQGRSSAQEMQNQVEKKQAPKEVERVDRAKQNIPGNKDHVHFKDKTALNYDGTISHSGNGTPKITRAIADWLERNGWKLPK